MQAYTESGEVEASSRQQALSTAEGSEDFEPFEELVFEAQDRFHVFGRSSNNIHAYPGRYQAEGIDEPRDNKLLLVGHFPHTVTFKEEVWIFAVGVTVCRVSLDGGLHLCDASPYFLDVLFLE